MKREAKHTILSSISEKLEAFNTELKGKFLCPTCLNVLDINDMSNIAKAHIIPKAAGGGIVTWLCSSCNSAFGYKQDKWFGEYLNLVRKHSFFDESITKAKFTVDDIPFNGAIRKKDGGIDIFIYSNRNPPNKVQRIIRELSEYRSTRKMTIQIPLLANRRNVDIGFVTAAYLYAFHIFGYSWILQKHMDSARNVIRGNCDIEKTGIHISNVEYDTDKRDLWFGIAKLGTEFAVCIKMMNKVVFFPPFYNINVVQPIKDPKGRYNIHLTRMADVPLGHHSIPFCMVIDDKLLIFPNDSINKKMISFVILIDSTNYQVTILDKIVDESFEKIHKVDRKIKISISEIEKRNRSID